MKVHTIKVCQWGDVGHFGIGKSVEESPTEGSLEVDAQARDGDVINADETSKSPGEEWIQDVGRWKMAGMEEIEEMEEEERRQTGRVNVSR